jgi:DNA-binding transcriptional regulator YdaS (Cro superfamily)
MLSCKEVLEIRLKICFTKGMEPNTPENPLDEAKKNAGGSTGLARALGDLTPQAISQWKVVPADRVLKVEEITGVSRHRLRPDIFGPAVEAAE